jgi:hypothetical protein
VDGQIEDNGEVTVDDLDEDEDEEPEFESNGHAADRDEVEA